MTKKCQNKLGHHFRTRLYSLPLKMLHEVYESTFTLHFTDVASAEHRLQGIIVDISSKSLFKAVRVGEPTETLMNSKELLEIS